MTRPPQSLIQRSDTPLSTKPSTSTASSMLWRSAHWQMSVTACFSPSLTRAEATSMRSTFTSRSSFFAICSFSCGTNDTPLVCSPSRRVVSMISIFSEFSVRN